jgi:hypothetical protein
MAIMAKAIATSKSGGFLPNIPGMGFLLGLRVKALGSAYASGCHVSTGWRPWKTIVKQHQAEQGSQAEAFMSLYVVSNFDTRVILIFHVIMDLYYTWRDYARAEDRE